jgi:inner membrane protein
MMFKTHLAMGVLASLFFVKSFSFEYPIFFIIVACFFSIFPDIDIPSSKIGRRTKPLSSILNIMFGHRKLFHSLIFALIGFGFLISFFENWIGAAFLLGYFVHLGVDALTVMGIKPFYPLSSFRIHGILKTNGVMDYLLFFFIIIGIIVLVI